MSLERSTPTSQPDDGSRRWLPAWICLGLAALVIAVFGQTVTHGFITMDDDGYVYQNHVVLQGLTRKGLAWAFGFHCDNWHPLTWMSHMLDCQLYGTNPAGHHLGNVLIHAAVVVILFLVLRSMTGALWRSAFVAAVFAIHPLRTESVAWVAERKDVLSGLLFVLTLAAYARYTRKPPSIKRYLLVIFLFALDLMAKPMVVTAPLILLLLDYWPLRRREPWKKLVLEKAPFFVLSAAACYVTLLAQREAIHAGPSFAPPLRLANGIVTYMVYLGQMVWPANLVLFYGYPHGGLPVWEVAMAVALLAGLSILAFKLRRRCPWIISGWLWYLIMLLPVIGIIQAGEQAHADRYTYLPSIGILLAVVWSVAELRLTARVEAGLAAAIVLTFSVAAFNQATYWKNGQTIWEHAVACARPGAVSDRTMADLYYGYGVSDMMAGDRDAAVAHYRDAIRYVPDYSAARVNLGNLCRTEGNMSGAISNWEAAVKGDPSANEAYNDLGGAYYMRGDYTNAVKDFQNSVRINPDDPWVKNNLGWVLATCPEASLRDGKKALELARNAIRLDGNDDPKAQMYRTLAAALAETGQYREAVGAAKRAVDLAESQGQQEMAQNFKLQLSFYEAGKPFHTQRKTP